MKTGRMQFKFQCARNIQWYKKASAKYITENHHTEETEEWRKTDKADAIITACTGACPRSELASPRAYANDIQDWN